jgi:transcriptional repressor NrdR
LPRKDGRSGGGASACRARAVKRRSGIRRACKNRPVSAAEVKALAEDVEEAMRADPRRPVPSAEIGREVLERLRDLDEVAYLRFASVYKDFQELDDFERELGLLLKRSPPKTEASE